MVAFYQLINVRIETKRGPHFEIVCKKADFWNRRNLLVLLFSPLMSGYPFPPDLGKLNVFLSLYFDLGQSGDGRTHLNDKYGYWLLQNPKGRPCGPCDMEYFRIIYQVECPEKEFRWSFVKSGDWPFLTFCGFINSSTHLVFLNLAFMFKSVCVCM